jgi:hypothetical protein
MAAAEGTGACPKQIVLGRFRQAKANMDVAAMTSAKTVHALSLWTWVRLSTVASYEALN